MSIAPRTAVLAVILAGAAFRLATGAALGLGVDETYYAVQNRDGFSLSFFDHPPLTFWVAAAAQHLLGGSVLALRLPFILLFAGTGWLMFRLTAHLFGPAAGFWAVLALNLAPFFAVAAGGWVLPDGLLDFCLLAAALCLAHLFFPAGEPAGPGRVWALWLAAGAALGFGLLAKYHALLFAAGAFLFVATSAAQRRWLRHPAPYAGAALALLLFSPVLLWNAQHEWVSFLFQAGRSRGGGGIKPGQFLAIVAGQAAYLWPWTLAALAALLWRGLRDGPLVGRRWFLVCAGVLPVAIFTLVPLWGPRGLPHWQMPGWLMLFPMLGAWLAARHAVQPAAVRRWATASAALLLLAAVAGIGHAVTGWAARLAPAAFAKGDPTLEALEWSAVREELARRGWLDRRDLFVVAVQWLEGAKLDRALRGRLPVLVFTGDPRHFAFRHDPAAFLGKDAIIVGRARNMRNAAGDYARFFRSVEPLGSLWAGRDGAAELELPMLYAHELVAPYPLPYGRGSR